jgi:glucokinase
MRRKFFIGIDLGGTNLRIALLDTKYRIISKFFLGTKEFKKKKDLMGAIEFCVHKIIKNNKIRKSRILGVGLGVPGPTDAGKGRVHFFPNIPGWKEVWLKRILERKLGLPVFLDNDAKAMALAEHKIGSARGYENVLCLTLGTGVGGGIIIENKLYRGASNAAGEIGHIPINEKGPGCCCGGIACLESYIGSNRILFAAKQKFSREISLEQLSELAKKQDKRALDIWTQVGERLGIALAGIINILNLDAIIIGGGVSGAGKILFAKVRETLRRRAMSVQSKHVKVLKARLGSDAGLIGAAMLVYNNG